MFACFTNNERKLFVNVFWILWNISLLSNNQLCDDIFQIRSNEVFESKTINLRGTKVNITKFG